MFGATSALLLAATSAAGGAVLGGAVVAEATATPEVIHACKGKTFGFVRLVDRAGACTTLEEPVSWNQAGPAGPPGSDGVDGAPGPGFTGIERIQAESDVNSDEPKTLEAHCPVGKIVFTGGARVASAASFPETAAAYLSWSSPTPTADLQLTSWVARAGEPTPTDRDWSIVVWVWCVDDPAASDADGTGA
ncbi:MAG: hypothetical protein ABWZ52_09160 [Acidimicrobiales bacterium]